MEKNKKGEEKEVVETAEDEKEKVEMSEEEKEEFADKVASDEDAYMEEESKKDEKDEEDKEEEPKEEFEEESEEEKDEDEQEDKEDEEEDSEEDKEDDKNFESLTVEQKYEVFRSAVKESLGCGYLESFDDEYLYVYDYCEGYTYKYSYVLEGTTCTIDSDSKGRVMRGGYVDFEVYEQEVNKIETLEKKNCELEEKLVAYEEAEKANAVEAILSEVASVISAESLAELREKSAEFSLDNLSVFENEVKAIGYEAVKNNVKTEKYSFTKMTVNENVSQKSSKYGW